ncbi:Inner membrane ABC transporter permease protein YdcU [Enterobacter sp. FY-07]|nr:Inner membrane ABC transporter permease protein YdcU [Enterobacter sp. FY-07]
MISKLTQSYRQCNTRGRQPALNWRCPMASGCWSARPISPMRYYQRRWHRGKQCGPRGRGTRWCYSKERGEMEMSITGRSSRRASLSGLFWRKPLLGLLLLLLGPLMWFGIVYLGSLLTLLWQGFYTFDDFTMSVTPDLTLANLLALFNPANYDIIVRTLVMAVSVTVASAILAFPMAWYMARYSRGKWKAFFYIAVMLPMWASYIVKAYAWTLLLAKDGVAQWFLNHLGLEPVLASLLALPAVGGNTLSTSGLGRFLVFVYIWLPFMILPIQAALERLPPSLLQASADLGAHPRQTFRYVVLPLAIPGVAAGSIFTFSLTLGDFIVPQLVGPPGYFIGNMVYSQQGAIGNMPMAAAFTLVPIVLIAIYLAFVKRLGAFDAL